MVCAIGRRPFSRGFPHTRPSAVPARPPARPSARRSAVSTPDTPPGLKPHGFSVHRPHQRRDSPKALSAPLDVSRRVLVAVQNQPAVRTDVGAHRERLVDALPTARTILRGIRRRNRFHSLAGACCLESEYREEVAPSGVLHTFVEAGLAACPVSFLAPFAVWLL